MKPAAPATSSTNVTCANDCQRSRRPTATGQELAERAEDRQHDPAEREQVHARDDARREEHAVRELWSELDQRERADHEERERGGEVLGRQFHGGALDAVSLCVLRGVEEPPTEPSRATCIVPSREDASAVPTQTYVIASRLAHALRPRSNDRTGCRTSSAREAAAGWRVLEMSRSGSN